MNMNTTPVHSEPESEPENEPEKKEISQEDWNQMFFKGEIKKQYMDMLVMDFLVNHNLRDVAETFHQESGCPLNTAEFSHTKSQKFVNLFILENQSSEAINLLNNTLGLSFLKARPNLHFRLEVQKMYELRFRDDFRGAYAFAPAFLMWARYDDTREECYNTIDQLFSGDVNAAPPSHFASYLKRYFLASETIEEMISLQGHEPESLIDIALAALWRVEYELNKEVKFPKFNS